MSTSVVSESQAPPASSTNRALRRLSQLRLYTPSHLISSSSSPTSPSSAGNQRRHRHNLSRVVSLSSPFHLSPTTDSAVEPLAASSVSPEPETHQADSVSSDSDLQEQSTSSASSQSIPASHEPSVQAAGMETQVMAADDCVPPTNGRPAELTSSTATAEVAKSSNKKPKMANTIRFFPYQDIHYSSRPSLTFSPMTRGLPSDDCVIRVGRHSERDGVPPADQAEPSDAPIGFKSKVVSRKHCEFSVVNGQWHIKDVGSSSGTFLNRTRLSQPNMVSRLYPVRDGDIVQLGIDFRGGEEMIFRCVRIRIECNRSWQQRPNEFNKNTEALINNLGKGKAAANYSGCRECSICLGSVLRPYQCLFMAACAHVWHYKCIRRLIHTPDYPMFQCPNCRAWTDLSAEVDDTIDLEDESHPEDNSDLKLDASGEADITNNDNTVTADERPPSNTQTNGSGVEDSELAGATEHLRLEERGTPTQDIENPDEPVSGASQSANIPIPAGPSSHGNSQTNPRSNTPNPEIVEDDPMTPRNDSGPLALDGRAGHL